jgi:transposase
MKVTTLGIDLAKSIFRLHGVDVRGGLVLRRQLTRKQVQPLLTRLEPCLVGMELAAALTIGPVRSASSAIPRS